MKRRTLRDVLAAARWAALRLLAGAHRIEGSCELCGCPLTGYAVNDGWNDEGDPIGTCIGCTPWSDSPMAQRMVLGALREVDAASAEAARASSAPRPLGRRALGRWAR